VDWKDREFKPYAHYFEDKFTDFNHQPILPKEYSVETDSRRPYRILCLDGGGIRGVLTTSLLVRLTRHNPKFLDNIDLIVGTSAGGILGLLLAAGYSANECDDIYTFASPHIFNFNPWRAINPFKSKYSDKQKQEIFQYYWGERTMMDLHKHAAVISFRLDGKKSTTHSFFNKEGWRPAVFSNLPPAGSSIMPDDELKVILGLYTSTYFYLNICLL
jgi:predicted acylesterase/phospholipase RssA